MSSNPVTPSHNVPAWLIRICQVIASWRGFVGTNLVSLLVGLLCSWLVASWTTDYAQTPWGTVLAYWPWWIVAVVIGELFFGLCKMVALLHPQNTLPEALKKEYLHEIINLYQNLLIESFPSDLAYDQVALRDIFIPLRFKTEKALDDKPLTRVEWEALEEGLKSGKGGSEDEAVWRSARRYLEHFSGNTWSFEELWQSLTCNEPAAVIQGGPGMGKSTLLLRLALHMAYRGLKEQDDLDGQRIEPLLIPLYISLGPYATFRKERKGQPEKEKEIATYLQGQRDALRELMSSGTVAWVWQELNEGRCLVLFDALDEVSDPAERKEVQEAIKTFIARIMSVTATKKQYNRFLITSRIAGYEANAFPYSHSILAELTLEQIGGFLPRWCQTSVDRNMLYADGAIKLAQGLVNHQAISYTRS